MLLLLDSGSTHSFINTNFAASIGAETVPLPAVQVKVANGQLIGCDSIVPRLTWTCQGHEFQTDLRVLDLGVYDGVLGMDWLVSFRPMQCNWLQKSISFMYKEDSITLQGILPSAALPLAAMDVQELLHLQTTNAIWSMALVEDMTAAATGDSVPECVSTLLTEFADVFAEP